MQFRVAFSLNEHIKIVFKLYMIKNGQFFLVINFYSF